MLHIAQFTPRMQIFLNNNTEPEPEICPLCLEKDSHYNKYGVCLCSLWEAWDMSKCTCTFDDYCKAFELGKLNELSHE